VTLNDFIIESLRDVRGFDTYWKASHQGAPAEFPMEMKPGDWFEQFLLFLQWKDEK
jgi:hypothetical protein